jgi:hypothetical protein
MTMSIRTPQTSKSFKLSNFSAPQSRIPIMQVIDIERYLFLGKQIIILLPAVHIKLGFTEHVSSHHWSFLPSHLLLLLSTTRCAASTSHSMAEGTTHDPHLANVQQADDKAKSDSGVESTAPVTSSSLTPAAIKMVEGKIPEMSKFFKKTTITEGECQAYHDVCWLSGSLVSTIPMVEIPTVHDSTVICFESHLIAGLGLPPSKFLVTIMSNPGCGLVHFNHNAIVALSCFTMLCECWLGITLDTSLFWYYYSLIWYRKVVYSGIRLSLWRHRWEEYLPAVFKGCWEGSQQRWILVDMHVQHHG